MADMNVPGWTGLGNYLKKLVDWGDGTWAERIASALYVSGSPVSASNPIPMLDAYTTPTAVTWNTGTAAGTAATTNTAGYDTVIVTLVSNAAFASGVVVFEVFDGSAWINIKAPTITDYTTTGATIAPTANTNKGYQVPVAGFPQFRVRLANVLTAGTLTVTLITSSAPDTSIVTVGLDPGTLQPVNPDGVTDGATFSGSASSAAVILTQNMQGFSGGTFRLSGTFSATVVLEGSDDNGTTWDAFYFVLDAGGGSVTGSATGPGAFRFFGNYQQIRLRVSAYTSGTVSAVLTLKRVSAPLQIALGAGYQNIGSMYLQSSSLSGLVTARITTGASGVIKATGGRLYTLGGLINAQASARYLQIYSKATAGVPGTDTPAFTIPLTASQVLPPMLLSDVGVQFANGISWAITTDWAGATIAASGDIVGSFGYA